MSRTGFSLSWLSVFTVPEICHNFLPPIITNPRRSLMPRPVTLFTGQWADLPLEDLARR